MTDDSFYAGMIAYEQLCEEMLVRSILPEDIQMFIQTQILDKAQIAFELFYGGEEK